MRIAMIAALFALLLPPAIVLAAPPSGSLYVDGGQSPVGIVLIPGRGQKPDGVVVGPMRKTLNKTAGFHTVSIQLPATTAIDKVTPEVQLAELKSIYPETRATILAAADFLRQEHGVKHVYLVAHSMGSTIAATMLAQDGPDGFTGVVLVSAGDYREPPFDTTNNAGRLPIPALDVYGDPSGITHPIDARLAQDDVQFAAGRVQHASNRYKQVHMAGAGHVFYSPTNEAALTKTIADWIADQEKAAR